MKKKNYIHYLFTFTLAIILSGCLPDSLTKFKKDTVEKNATAPSSNVITTESGESIDKTTIQPISSFYLSEGSVRTPFNYSVGSDVTLEPYFNGTFGLGSESVKKSLFVSCRMTGVNALPYGLQFIGNSATTPCQIKGKALETASANGAGLSYTMELKTIGTNGIEHTITTSFTIGVFVTPNTFSYQEPNKLILKIEDETKLTAITPNLDDTKAPYSSTGFASTPSGAVGVIKAVDLTNKLVAINKVVELTLTTLGPSVPSAVTTHENLSTESSVTQPWFLCDANGAIARVIRVKNAGLKLYLEMLNHKSFSTASGANAVGFTNDETCAATVFDLYVSAVNATKSFSTKTPDVAVSVDFQSEYQTAVTQLTNVQFAYEVGRSISNLPAAYYPPLSINPSDVDSTLDSGLNGIQFTVSPALPAGISITSDGAILGSFQNVVNSTQYTITASNPVGSSSTKIYLNAQRSPQDLSYTQNQLLSVSSHSAFTIGQTIQENPAATIPIAADKLKKAIVINRYNDAGIDSVLRNRLSVQNLNGDFVTDQKFYSHISYAPNIPYVLGPLTTLRNNTDFVTNYNFALLTNSTLTGLSVNSYIRGSTSNALAKVAYIYSPIAPGRQVVFAKSLLDTTTGTVKHFNDAETFCVVADATSTTCTSAAFVIGQVEANSYLATASLSSHNYRDIEITNADISVSAYAVIDPISTTTKYWLTEFSRQVTTTPAAPFPTTENRPISSGDLATVPNASPLASGNLTLVEAASNYFLSERSEDFSISAAITNGANAFFSITPDLPEGLTINSATGLISGTPAKKMDPLTYTVTAYNLVGKTQYKINLEVRDYFKIKNKSFPQASIFHKTGNYAHTRECKLDANAISVHKNTEEVYRTCFLDAEELDLYYYGLKYQLTAGNGTCNFARYSPYSFWSYRPLTTAGTIYYSTDGCTPGSIPGGATQLASPPDPASNAICTGNYESSEGPNCDSGNVYHYSYSVGDTAPNCGAPTVTRIDCGGKKVNCLQGAIRDTISATDLENNVRRIVINPNEDGIFNSEYSHEAPIKLGKTSNFQLANDLTQAATTCNASFNNSNLLVQAMNTTSETLSPFGKANPYYTFLCLDGGADPIAGLRVIVRDWDKQFDLGHDVDNFAPTSTAYSYPAGVYDSVSGELINSYISNKDVFTSENDFYGVGGNSCGTPVTNATGVSNRYPGDNY